MYLPVESLNYNSRVLIRLAAKEEERNHIYCFGFSYNACKPFEFTF